MSDTVVIGLGNPLMGDDGLGPEVIAQLRQLWVVPDEVSLIDGGTAGLGLLPMIEGAARVLFVDAIDANRRAGAPIALAGAELPRYFAMRLSSHEIDVREVLALAEFRGTLPADIRAFGLQPCRVKFGLGLSPAVRRGVPALTDAVVRQLAAWGHDVRCTS